MIAICLLIAGSAIISFAKGTEEKEDGTKLNLWIPGFAVKIAGSIVKKHEGKAEGELIKKFGSMNICIREGDKYGAHTDKKMTRKISRLDQRNYEPLVKINADNTTVDVRIRENKKGVIKRFVCLVDETDEAYVYVKMHCRLKPEEVAGLIEQIKDKDLIN